MRLAVTVAACMLSSCVYYVYPTVENHVALTSDEQVLQMAHDELAKFSPQISYKWSGAGDVYKRAMAVADQLLREGNVVSFSVSTHGQEVTLAPTYADNVYLLRAHRDPAWRSALSARQQQALAVAEQAVQQAQASAGSQYEVALALHDFLVEHSTYERELQGRDTANAATRLLLSGRGVCDAYTRAYQLMLSIAGIENMFVAGVAQKDNHCWNLARLDGRWVHIDCTYSDPMPDEPGRVYHTHFALTDSLIARDHTWNRANYPAATAIDLYYPVRYAAFANIDNFVLWCSENRRQHVTAYIEELRQMGRNYAEVQQRIERMHAHLGRHVIVNFAIDEHLPGVIVCKCNTHDSRNRIGFPL